MESSNKAGDSLYSLNDGANIAVIGGGPSGSFFSIFAYKMAKMVGKDIKIIIFEPKEFQKEGPAGCNKCGGVISERLIQTLALEGINIPPEVVQRGIDSYYFYTQSGNVHIKSPGMEKRIATVYRGGGPRDIKEKNKSFDQFLLDYAIQEGASHEPLKIDEIKYRNKPVLFSKGKELMEADLVIGAFGVNSPTAELFEKLGFRYKKPSITTASNAEIHLGREKIQKYFGSSIHLFLVPVENIKFAAIIPKGHYATACILGKDINSQTVKKLLSHPVVKNIFPDEVLNEHSCQCFPKMNIRRAKNQFADRIVAIGDAGSTRLLKDGLGAAYFLGKAAAKTAIFYGVSAKHFEKYFAPASRAVDIDNIYGRFLFATTGIYRNSPILSGGMLEVVKKEQRRSDNYRILSSVLWDMFTGSELYKNIFFRTLNFKMIINLLAEFLNALWRKLR